MSHDSAELHEAIFTLTRELGDFRAEISGSLGEVRVSLERLQDQSAIVQATVAQLNDRSIAAGVRQEDHTQRLLVLERETRSSSTKWTRTTGIYVGITATLAFLASIFGLWQRFVK